MLVIMKSCEIIAKADDTELTVKSSLQANIFGSLYMKADRIVG